MTHHCVCCTKRFTPRNHLQNYCNAPGCQRKRKSTWQKEKLATDSAYRENQHDAQQEWRNNNRDYMRKYRRDHPAYVDHNRELQKKRNEKPSDPLPLTPPEVVKMDARSTVTPFLLSGRYTLTPVSGDGDIVKMDTVIVELTVFEGVT